MGKKGGMVGGTLDGESRGGDWMGSPGEEAGWGVQGRRLDGESRGGALDRESGGVALDGWF